MSPEIPEMEKIVRSALEEDIGDGDVTTLSIVPVEKILKGHFIARRAGIIAGLQLAHSTFSILDKEIEFVPHAVDGASVDEGDVVASVCGRGQALLSGERVALNFLQRMSGIATLTRRFVDAVDGTSAVILDTRKTAPRLRHLDKWAVRLGGGQNHRMGLYDMALIKENHIAVAGSIANAVRKVRENNRQKCSVEVEVRNLAELREALQLKVQRILLDNMSLDDMQTAVHMTQGRIALEASGNVNLENVAEIAASGVGYISIGRLTHSVSALDITFLIHDKIREGKVCKR